MKALTPFVLALLTTSACGGPTYTATDGKTFTATLEERETPLLAAARESAKHDIPCTDGVVRVRRVRGFGHTARGFDRAAVTAEGCGTRLTYGIDTTDPHLVLTDWGPSRK
jgi:hypothetical protein